MKGRHGERKFETMRQEKEIQKKVKAEGRRPSRTHTREGERRQEGDTQSRDQAAMHTQPINSLRRGNGLEWKTGEGDLYIYFFILRN